MLMRNDDFGRYTFGSACPLRRVSRLTRCSPMGRKGGATHTRADSSAAGMVVAPQLTHTLICLIVSAAVAEVPSWLKHALTVSYHLLLVVSCCLMRAADSRTSPPGRPCPLCKQSLNQMSLAPNLPASRLTSCALHLQLFMLI